MSEASKECSVCRRVIALADFHRVARNPDGRDNRCKRCVNERSRKNRRGRGRVSGAALYEDFTESRRELAAIRKQEIAAEERVQAAWAQMRADREAIVNGQATLTQRASGSASQLAL